MKLIIAIVQDQDSMILIDELMAEDFRVTKLSSTGGFLKQGNTTLLMGVEEDKVKDVLSIIEKNCKTREVTSSLLGMSMHGEGYIPYPIEVQVGGATIFVLDIEEFVTY